MAVSDKKILNNAGVAQHCLNVPITTATGQTGLSVELFTPGFPFQITGVSVFASAVTATISCDVLIGSTSVLSSAVTPVANTETAGTLSSTLANRRGSASGQIKVQYTTNGSGAATNLHVKVSYRPYPMNGDAAL